MRVLCVIPELNSSGAPKVLAWVANYLSKFEKEVTVLSLYSQKKEQPLNCNVNFECLGLKKSKFYLIRNSIQMFFSIIKLSQYIDQHRFDVVISFRDSVSFNYLLFTRKKESNPKFILSERVDPFSYKFLSSFVKKKGFGKADGCVFQTEQAMHFFGSKICKDSIVIPNPVIKKDEYDAIPTLEFNCRENFFVSSGRLVIKQKRQDVLIKAFALFLKEFPDYKLYIYGDGEDKRKIEKIIKKNNLTKNAFIMGNVANVEKKIYNAKAFVFTSDYEGIPNSLIEALLIGVPSIATDCSPGGARMLIQDGINGFLVKRGDFFDIYKKMLILATDSDISNRFSNNSINIKNRFNEKSIGDMWNNFIEKIATKI